MGIGYSEILQMSFFYNFVTERTGLPLKILKEYNIKINWKITHVTG